MASSSSTDVRTSPRLVALAVAAAVAAGACQGAAADTVPDAVAADIRGSIGVDTDVRCTSAAGGEVEAEAGARFTCTATSPDLDGTIVVEGAYVSAELTRSRPVGGTGALGAVAGFVAEERP